MSTLTMMLDDAELLASAALEDAGTSPENTASVARPSCRRPGDSPKPRGQPIGNARIEVCCLWLEEDTLLSMARVLNALPGKPGMATSHRVLRIWNGFHGLVSFSAARRARHPVANRMVIACSDPGSTAARDDDRRFVRPLRGGHWSADDASAHRGRLRRMYA